MQPSQSRRSIGTIFLRTLGSLAGAALVTVVLLFLLAVIEGITSTKERDDQVVAAPDVAQTTPPDTPEIDEPEPEPEEEPPPELEQDNQPLDLNMLEMALDSGVGDGFFGGGDLGLDLGNFQGGSESFEEELADMDRQPTIIDQPLPRLSPKAQKRTPGTVKLKLIVDEKGRVEKHIITYSSDRIFEGPVVKALKKWRFNPGQRNGKPAKGRTQITVSFPKS